MFTYVIGKELTHYANKESMNQERNEERKVTKSLVRIVDNLKLKKNM